MTKPSNTQSQKRFNESVGQLFGEISSETCLFLKSSSDEGVIRNGGRNGARFAPQSFLSALKRFSQDENIKNFSFSECEVSHPAEEANHFHEAQKLEIERIKKVVSDHKGKRIIHIGGGHDHIYPLLSALSDDYQKVIVINIDAHADTRTDENYHSGTPFRQFSEGFKGEFLLYQIGLHTFANSFSTLSPLKSKHEILWKKDFSAEAVKEFFKKITREIDQNTLVVFSLDADAIDGSKVPGVSAVNPDGFSYQDLLQMWKAYQALPLNHSPVLGIYELNPVYDTLASVSMRTMAAFVFETFRKD